MAEFRIIEGVMGSGKSYYGAQIILECLREGGVVHTNLPLRLDVLTEMGYADQIVMLPQRVSDIVKLQEMPRNADGSEAMPVLKSDYLRGGEEGRENLVVIDEASLQFDIDQQMKDREKNKPIFQLVALTRHVGLDMYFLAQSAQNIDAKLRRMAQGRVRCVRTDTIPF